jgi:hypothetical protein
MKDWKRFYSANLHLPTRSSLPPCTNAYHAGCLIIVDTFRASCPDRLSSQPDQTAGRRE